jgi:hypothetical protein
LVCCFPFIKALFKSGLNTNLNISGGEGIICEVYWCCRCLSFSSWISTSSSVFVWRHIDAIGAGTGYEIVLLALLLQWATTGGGGGGGRAGSTT